MTRLARVPSTRKLDGNQLFTYQRSPGHAFVRNRSCRLVAGTPRYENGGLVAGIVCRSLEVFGCGWCHPLPPLWIPAFAGVSVLDVKGFQMAGE